MLRQLVTLVMVVHLPAMAQTLETDAPMHRLWYDL